MLYLFLRDELRIEEHERRMLHFAPERALRRRLQNIAALAYVTTDISGHNVDVTADIAALPFDAGSFDLILCSHVLEHVTDDRRAIRELYRVLAPGGLAIVLLPLRGQKTFEDWSVVSPEARLRVFGQEDHVRIVGRDYTERLKEAGFRVEELDYAARFTAEERQRHGLKRQTFYLCRRHDAE